MAGVLTLDLAPGALPDAGAALALDRQANLSRGAWLGYPHSVFVQALGNAVRDGSPQVAVVDMSADQVYQVRDMLDDALASLPGGSPPAGVLQALIERWDALTGCTAAKATGRDIANGKQQRARYGA